MKAGVFYGAGDIRYEDVPEPKIGPDGIIVKVKASGICGSDLHPYRLGAPMSGIIFGHESSGEVVEVGANVKSIKVGDRMVAVPVDVCHECHWCKNEQYEHCLSFQMPGWHIPGAYAEYVAIPYYNDKISAPVLPDNVSFEEGAAVEPLSVGLFGVTKAGVKPEDKVVVIGAGMIGLCIVQVLRAIGVSQIIVSGRRSKRLELARQCGAEIVVNAAQDDVVQTVRDTWPGRMADVVFECAGVEATLQQSIEIVRTGGKVVLEGIFEQTFDWSLNAAISKDVSLIGCLGEDFPGTMDLLRSGKVDMKPLITHEFPLQQVKEAFDAALHADDAIKVLLKP